MNLACLCPVFGNPAHLINTAIECFLRQMYPAESRSLVVFDDLGVLGGVRFDCKNVNVATSTFRQPSLSAKYNVMARLVEQWADAIVVWEVDDLQMPWVLDCHRAALEHHQWSQANQAWSTYGGNLHLEPVDGNLHGSLAIRRDAFLKIGGWPETKRADFDQQLIRRLKDDCGPRGLPNGGGLPPGYCFRWGDTGCTHGQGTMRSPDDETWYDRYEPFSRDRITELTPRLDGNAERTFNEIMLRAQDWKR